MLGIDYGSDSDTEDGTTQNSTVLLPKTKAATKPSAKLAMTLPPPSAASKPSGNASSTPSSSSGGLSVPPPKPKKKKIMVELPKLAKHEDDDGLESERPALKKPRLGGGTGMSALLSMLPAPKKISTQLVAAPRVLGGGRPGIVYSAASRVEDVTSTEEESHLEGLNIDDPVLEEKPSTFLIPPSLALSKGKAKAVSAIPPAKASAPLPTSEPTIDFFSLGSASASRTTAVTSIPQPSNQIPSLSAAPKVEEYRPPSPTIHDPYPGYYTLPSGQWAMHDPAYYKTYSDRWTQEYNKQIREYERGLGGDEKGFEGVASDALVDVDAQEQLDAAQKEREEKKALTKTAARENDLKAPNMKINPQKAGGLARTRHQLSTLLTEAYTNREALEERIAQGRRNRKEAGNKYGF